MNWTFLLPKMKLKVKNFHTEYTIFPEKVGTLKDIPEEIIEKYLADGTKFDINHPLILEGVEEAIGNEKNPYWMMKKIFDYICEKINYKLKPLGGWIPVDVSAGDSPIPAKRARRIGVLQNKYLITTIGGGDSEYLEFYYNFNAKWKTRGKCKIYTQQFGEFLPDQ